MLPLLYDVFPSLSLPMVVKALRFHVDRSVDSKKHPHNGALISFMVLSEGRIPVVREKGWGSLSTPFLPHSFYDSMRMRCQQSKIVMITDRRMSEMRKKEGHM